MDATAAVGLWKKTVWQAFLCAALFAGLHYLNPVPLHEITVRWIGKFERGRLDALRDLKERLEGRNDDGNGDDGDHSET